MDYTIVVHGGAGDWQAQPEQLVLGHMEAAVEAARHAIAGGGNAVDAAVEAVRYLEDTPLFNAGTGSVLNFDGEVEMDAGLMDGTTLAAGGVGGLRRVRNPILVARKVMELTDHVLLVGAGALRFARAVGFGDHDPVTEERRRGWVERRDQLLATRGEDRIATLHRLLAEAPPEGPGTVGAVVLDPAGRLAAATSTGGIHFKLPGRVGDSAIPGAGNYATEHGAASATGRGELMLRYLSTKAVCDEIWAGHSASRAVSRVLRRMATAVGQDAGIIAVDSEGRVGVGHLTAAMPHAYIGTRHPELHLAMRAER